MNTRIYTKEGRIVEMGVSPQLKNELHKDPGLHLDHVGGMASFNLDENVSAALCSSTEQLG